MYDLIRSYKMYTRDVRANDAIMFDTCKTCYLNLATLHTQTHRTTHNTYTCTQTHSTPTYKITPPTQADPPHLHAAEQDASARTLARVAQVKAKLLVLHHPSDGTSISRDIKITFW